MQPQCCVLPLPCVPARVTRDVLVADRHPFVPPLYLTCHYHRIRVVLSVSLWNHLDDLEFHSVGLTDFNSKCLVIFKPMPFRQPSFLFFSFFRGLVG